MIKFILTTIVTLLPLFVGAQQKISYAYDANGNRVSRTKEFVILRIIIRIYYQWHVTSKHLT